MSNLHILQNEDQSQDQILRESQQLEDSTLEQQRYLQQQESEKGLKLDNSNSSSEKQLLSTSNQNISLNQKVLKAESKSGSFIQSQEESKLQENYNEEEQKKYSTSTGDKQQTQEQYISSGSSLQHQKTGSNTSSSSKKGKNKKKAQETNDHQENQKSTYMTPDVGYTGRSDTSHNTDFETGRDQKEGLKFAAGKQGYQKGSRPVSAATNQEDNLDQKDIQYVTKVQDKLQINIPTNELQIKLGKYKLKTKNMGRKVDITPAILKLQDRINDVIDEFIEVYEVELFDLTRVHMKELGSKMISFSSLGLIHHVYTLKYGEHATLSEKDQSIVDQNFEKTLKQNPQAIKEYRFMLQCISFISAMLIKWGLVAIEEYKYRLQRFAINMKFLDLIILNRDIITVETLWLTVAVYQAPLRNIVSDKILAYARKVQLDFMRMLGFMLKLNQNIDFEKIQNLQPVVAAKNKKLRRLKGWIPDRDIKVTYQTLDIGGICSCSCLSGGANARTFKLRDYMQVFEKSYRRFESQMVHDFKKLAIK